MEPVTITANLANATPMRGLDWMAYRDPEDVHGYGYGRTPNEAFDDLLRLEAEEACWQRCAGRLCDGSVDCRECPMEEF